MKAKILKSVLELELKDTHLTNGYNLALSQLQSWEKSFGINSSVCFDQDIKFCKSEFISMIFKTLYKLESQGYISLDLSYCHVRPSHVKNDDEWKFIDQRVTRLAKKGIIILTPNDYNRH